MIVIGFGTLGSEGGRLPSRESLQVRHNFEDLDLDGRMVLKCMLQKIGWGGGGVD